MLFWIGWGILHNFSDLFGKTGRGFLESLKLEYPYKENLERQLRIINLPYKEIKQIEKEIRRRIQKDPQALRLMTIKEIGFILAYLFVSEIGDIRRFPSVGKLASYCGLAPVVKQSGGFAHYGYLTKTGNTLLCWGFIEADPDGTMEWYGGVFLSTCFLM